MRKGSQRVCMLGLTRTTAQFRSSHYKGARFSVKEANFFIFKPWPKGQASDLMHIWGPPGYAERTDTSRHHLYTLSVAHSSQRAPISHPLTALQNTSISPVSRLLCQMLQLLLCHLGECHLTAWLGKPAWLWYHSMGP